MLNSMKNFITSPNSQLLTKIGIVGFALYAAFNYKATDNKEHILHKPAISTAEIVITENKTTELPPVKRKPQVNVEYAQSEQSETVIKPQTKPLEIAQVEHKKEPHKTARHMQSINTLNMEYPILEHFRKSSHFGPRKGKAHDGIDIATRIGTPIITPADSEVAYSGWSNGYGNTIILYHGSNVYSLYAHLKNGSTNKLKKGQFLQQGVTFAQTGNTGGVKAHLHTEVIIADNNRRNGYVVNPQNVWNNANLSDLAVRNSLIEKAKATMGSRMDTNSAVFKERIVKAEYDPDNFDSHIDNTKIASIQSVSRRFN